MQNKVVVLIGATSDIGTALAIRYAKENCTIVGTWRSRSQLEKLASIPNLHLFHCDLSDRENISAFEIGYAKLNLRWDVLISCPCNPLPLKAFFDCDFDEWADSVHVNVIEQLRLLHRLYPLRNQSQGMPSVVFFGGGGFNSAPVNFSAYTISKIMLMKMCELLDAENEDLNAFMVEPGWTRTKVHSLILANVEKGDRRYRETIDFINNKGKGTDMDDIYTYIKWLCAWGHKTAGGRSFVVADAEWRGKVADGLIAKLRKRPEIYRLRRMAQ